MTESSSHMPEKTDESEQTAQKADTAGTPGLLWVVIGCVVAAAFVIGAWYLAAFEAEKVDSRWGPAGDATAPMTGLVTALALVFAIYATLLQRKDLLLQQQEMKDATKVQKQIVKRQQKLAEAQESAANALLRAARAQEKVLDMDMLSRLHADCQAKFRGIDAAAKVVEEIVRPWLDLANPSPPFQQFITPLIARRHAFQGSFPAENAKRLALLTSWMRRVAIETEAEREKRLVEMLEVAQFYDTQLVEIEMLRFELGQKSAPSS